MENNEYIMDYAQQQSKDIIQSSVEKADILVKEFDQKFGFKTNEFKHSYNIENIKNFIKSGYSEQIDLLFTNITRDEKKAVISQMSLNQAGWLLYFFPQKGIYGNPHYNIKQLIEEENYNNLETICMLLEQQSPISYKVGMYIRTGDLMYNQKGKQRSPEAIVTRLVSVMRLMYKEFSMNEIPNLLSSKELYEATLNATNRQLLQDIIDEQNVLSAENNKIPTMYQNRYAMN